MCAVYIRGLSPHRYVEALVDAITPQMQMRPLDENIESGEEEEVESISDRTYE